MIGHGNFRPITIYKVSRSLGWAEIQVRITGTHDLWVLLAPSRLASDMDNNIHLLVNLQSRSENAKRQASNCYRFPNFDRHKLDF
jgi:hypothetical protein